MPVQFSQIASKHASVTITGGTLGDESITVVYYPGRLTDNLLASMQQLQVLETGNMAGLSGLFSLNDVLCELIVSWDVLDSDGSMYPLDPKRLKELPVPFKAEVLYALVNDLRPEALAPQAHRQNGSL